ncbi:uncharacterized protein LOC128662298 [Bombina bombina]|uniref:uncharacterized protein LOC128662298 n=1 Tax=Bombina bombina TaxID=8345 RepID=UPI00235AE19F|nr:uncharacterized protein LOC128662298 [Bombina bombina]
MTSTAPLVNSGDIEHLLAPYKRNRCIDYCLVISVVLLTFAVGSLSAFYLLLDRPHMERSLMDRRNHQTSSAHLLTENVLLKNDSMRWISTSGIANVFMSSDFRYDDGDLIVTRVGLYYVYSQMSLTCKSADECLSDSSVSLTIQKSSLSEQSNILKLNIQLTESSKQSLASTFSGTLQLFSVGDRLRSKLWTDRLQMDWQLDQMNTFMGLFWVSENPSQDNDP